MNIYYTKSYVPHNEVFHYMMKSLDYFFVCFQNSNRVKFKLKSAGKFCANLSFVILANWLIFVRIQDLGNKY